MTKRATDRFSGRLLTWNIGRKLTVASILMTALVVFIGGISIWQTRVVARAVDDLSLMEQQRAYSLHMLASGKELIASLHHMIATEDATLTSTRVPVSMGTLQFYMGSLQAQAEKSQTSYFPEEKSTLYSELQQAVGEVNLLARQEQWDEAHTVLMEDVIPVNDSLGRLLRQLVSRNNQKVKATVARTQGTVERVRLLAFASIALTTVVALGWRQFIFQGMTHSIAELRQGVARITGGDLAHELDIRTGDEIEELGNEFNKMASRLADLIGGLEERVAERTRELEDNLFELEGAAQVARQAASIRDLNELLDETVHLISVLFGFYHTGIFLIDEAGEYAILQAASSGGGRRMLERGHRLRVGEVGIVGFVADAGVSRIALDVGEDAVHFKNPDLPYTRSEMAVPLEVRGEIIGVLDVQSIEKEAFTDQDVAIIKTLGDQIALAIENARLLEESQRAVRELEILYGRRVREAWGEQAAHRPYAYRYTGVSVEAAPSSGAGAAEDSLHRETTIVQEDGGDGYQLAAPIRLRGQRIGSIVLRRGAEEEPWSSEDIALMEEASDQIALALESARLLEESQRRAARERLTGEVTARMRETLDVETVLRTAVDEVQQALELDKVTVRLAARDSNGGRA